ncbi:hypothetical protein [Desulfoluna limicola]|nr:hypothetical protein [Desulfoluna limicola]
MNNGNILKNMGVWLTWEDHRRSKELSKNYGIEYKYIKTFEIFQRFRATKYPVLITKTLFFIMLKKPNFIVVQNPSVVLTFIVCLAKKILKFYLVVDRHSNFKIEKKNSKELKYRMFHYLSSQTIKEADLTVVTNKCLKDLIESMGGRGFVLEDKIPSLTVMSKNSPSALDDVVCICSFSDDEPIEEVAVAASYLRGVCDILVTGDYNKNKQIRRIKRLSHNFILTGYLAEQDYINLLSKSKIIMALTTQEYTLTCGSYEAVALEKPLIVSNTETQKNFFDKGVIFTELSPDAISMSINYVLSNYTLVQERMRLMKISMKSQWEMKSNNLIRLINDGLK